MTVAFSTPTLMTERLTLRGFKPSDADPFVSAFTQDRMQYAGGPMTPKLAWRHFVSNIGHWVANGFGMFIVTWRGEDRPLGIVGHWYPLGWAEKEVGWVLFDDADEGKGIAQEAAQASLDQAFGPLGWDTAVSYIAPENTGSIKLAERLGATLDPEAPKPETTSPCLIYRHPKPQGRVA